MLLFLALLLLVIICSLSLIPNNNVKDRVLSAILDKHELLENSDSPRIVLVGGSNVNMGLNSRQIQKSLGRTTVNASSNAGLGLKFMLADVEPRLREGDTLVVIPEFKQFTDGFHGGYSLTVTLVDIYPAGWKHLDFNQKVEIIPNLVKYAAEKLWTIGTITQRTGNQTAVYSRATFNEFGDAEFHWDLKARPFAASRLVTTAPELHSNAIPYLLEYKNRLEGNGINFVLLPPVIQSTSFDNQELLIERIVDELKQAGIPFAADCRRYKFDNSLFFDSPYHLLREGIDSRTKLIVEDLETLMTEFDFTNRGSEQKPTASRLRSQK